MCLEMLAVLCSSLVVLCNMDHLSRIGGRRTRQTGCIIFITTLEAAIVVYADNLRRVMQDRDKK